MAGDGRFKGINPAGWCPRSRGALAGKITSRFDLDEGGPLAAGLPSSRWMASSAVSPGLAGQAQQQRQDGSGPSRPWRCQSGPSRLQAKGCSRPRPGSWMRIWMRPSLGNHPGLGRDIKGQVRVTGSSRRRAWNADLVSGRLACGHRPQGDRHQGPTPWSGEARR